MWYLPKYLDQCTTRETTPVDTLDTVRLSTHCYRFAQASLEGSVLEEADDSHIEEQAFSFCSLSVSL